MWKSATITRVSFGFLLLNLILVVTVAMLRPVFAQQKADDTISGTPEVQVPDDPPSLPTASNAPAAQPSIVPQLSDTAATGAVVQPAAPNKMVMDEILKAIQEGRGELDVPPLSYPALPLKSNVAKKGALQQLSQRMKSIAQLTQSAQALIAEAQQLESAGQAEAARALAEHVQTLRYIIMQLAAESGSTIGPPTLTVPQMVD